MVGWILVIKQQDFSSLTHQRRISAHMRAQHELGSSAGPSLSMSRVDISTRAHVLPSFPQQKGGNMTACDTILLTFHWSKRIDDHLNFKEVGRMWSYRPPSRTRELVINPTKYHFCLASSSSGHWHLHHWTLVTIHTIYPSVWDSSCSTQQAYTINPTATKYFILLDPW